MEKPRAIFPFFRLQYNFRWKIFYAIRVIYGKFSIYQHCSGTEMKLRTDTIGHFEQPTEIDIRSAISYPGEKASENDLVKLMIDDQNYLCVWIGKKEIGHTLEIKTDATKLACKDKIDSESAIQVMIKYFHEDLDWINQYSWEKSISQKFFENIQLLVKQKSKPEHSA